MTMIDGDWGSNTSLPALGDTSNPAAAAPGMGGKKESESTSWPWFSDFIPWPVLAGYSGGGSRFRGLVWINGPASRKQRAERGRWKGHGGEGLVYSESDKNRTTYCIQGNIFIFKNDQTYGRAGAA